MQEDKIILKSQPALVKKLGLLIGIILLVTAETSLADRLLSLTIPTEPVNTRSSSDIASYMERYKEYPAVILSVDVSIEHSGSKARWPKPDYKFKLGDWNQNWQYTVIVKNTYLILKPELTELTTFDFPVKLKKGYFQIEYPNGEAELYTASEMKKRTTNGVTDYYFAFPRVVPGTIITIAYQDELTQQYIRPLNETINLQLFIPIRQIQVTYLYPEWWKVNVRQLGPNESIPLHVTTDTAEHRTIISYSANDVPAFRAEPFAPNYRSVRKQLNLQVTYMKMGGPAVNQGQSWDTLARDFRRSNLKKSGNRSRTMEKLVDSLIRPTDSPLIKVNRILSYISGTIEMSNRQYEADITKILRLKKGNAYDVTALARAMLIHAGFTVDYLLAHDAYSGYFDPEYVSYTQLALPALRVKLDTQYLTLFPAYPHLLPPLIPPQYQNQDALIITKDAEKRLWNIPANSESGSTHVDSFFVAVEEAGDLRMHHKASISGSDGYLTRYQLKKLHPNEKIDSLRTRIKYRGLAFSIDSIRMTNDTIYHEPFITESDITFHNAVTQTPSELIIQTADMFPLTNDTLLGETTQRINDVVIYQNVTYTRTITFAVPSGWVLSDLPDSETTETSLGTVTNHWSTTPDGVQVQQIVSLKQTTQPKEKYPELLTLLGRNGKSAIPPLVFTKQP